MRRLAWHGASRVLIRVLDFEFGQPLVQCIEGPLDFRIIAVIRLGGQTSGQFRRLTSEW